MTFRAMLKYQGPDLRVDSAGGKGAGGKRCPTRMALSMAIHESFNSKRHSVIAIENSVSFGCLEGTANIGAPDCSIRIL